MTTLEEKLGYTFQNTALLENALTHSSCANESRGKLQSRPTTCTATTPTCPRGS